MVSDGMAAAFLGGTVRWSGVKEWVELRGRVVSSGTCGRLWSLGDGDAEWLAVPWRQAVDGREMYGC